MTDAWFLALVVGVPLVLAGLDVWELWQPPRAGEPVRPGGSASPAALAAMALVLAVYLAIQVGVGRLVPGAVEVVAWVTGGRGGRASGTGVFAAVVVGLYVAGLVDYAVHRWMSHSRILFWTHEYHHLPSQVMLLMPGLAARPFAVVAGFPVVVGAAVAAYGTLAALGEGLGDPRPMQWLLIAQVVLLVTSHSCWLRRFDLAHRWVTRLGLVTAREHLLHHAVDRVGNFANLTTVWDRVFGTYLDPDVVLAERLGLGYDQDWLGAVTLSLIKIPPRWRERLQVGRWCNLG